MTTVWYSGFQVAGFCYENNGMEGNSDMPIIPMDNKLISFNLSSVTGLSTITNSTATIPSNY